MKPARLALGVAMCAIVSAPMLQGAAAGEPSVSTAAADTLSKLRSADDGWVDISGFLDQAYGFAPIVIPVTEPAVGYGLAGGLMFVDKPRGEARAGFGRPNITFVGGLGTENGTWGLMAGDSRNWLDEQVQTLAGFVYASVNLDFYGIGEDAALKDHPLSYTLEPLGGMAQVEYRLGTSRVWAGIGYAWATTKVMFDAPDATPGLPDFESDSRVGGLRPSINYDSRENIFTPRRGTYLEAIAGVFSQALGGDGEFQRVSLTAMQFLPLHPRLTLGVRGGATFSFGDVPFYMRPFVVLRGVPAMRYQGGHTAELETELRWQFWKRISLVGFAGYGAAWNDFERFDEAVTVFAGGTGLRYELAREYGLHMGIDVAFSPDVTAVYVQFGSAWLRP